MEFSLLIMQTRKRAWRHTHAGRYHPQHLIVETKPSTQTPHITVHISASLDLQANGKTREYEGSILLYFFAKIKQKHSLLAKAGSDRVWQLGSVSLNRERHIFVDSGRDTLCLLHVKGAFLCANKITAVKWLGVNIGQSSPQARDT